MTIPYGVVSVIAHTGGEYFIEPYRSGLPETLGRDVASEFSISFDVAGTDGLTMTIRDKSGDDVRKYPSTQALDLRFDNYCNAVQTYNDFINFYDWLYDTTSADPAEPKRFVAGKLIRINLLPPGPALAGRIMGRQGDCDPIIIDPPPGP